MQTVLARPPQSSVLRHEKVEGRLVGLWKPYAGSGNWLDQSGLVHDFGLPGGAANAKSLRYPPVHIWLPGAANNNLSTPHAAANNITSHITIEGYVGPDDWTHTANQVVAAKWEGASNNAFLLRIATTGVLTFVASADGVASSYSATSTAAGPGVDGVGLWVRACRNATTGTVRFYTSPDRVTWTKLGNDVATTAGAIASSTTAVLFGSRNLGSTEHLLGALYRACLYAADLGDTTGTPVVDVDTSFATSESSTFLEQANGATVTINRAATGRKSTVANRDMWLLGVDDYFAIADHADFDFAAADSFTIAIVARVYGSTATQTFMAKKIDAALGAGYVLHRGANGLTPTFVIGDGIASATATGPAMVAGRDAVIVAVRDVAADTVTVYTQGIAGSPVADATALTLANGEELRVGRLSSVGTNYLDGNVFAGAVIRRALSAGEVMKLTTELAA